MPPAQPSEKRKTQHTLGPWEIGEWIRSDGGAVYRSIFGLGRRLASVTVFGSDRNGITGGRIYRDATGTYRKARTITKAEADANARLIAAAPELLEAAKDAVVRAESHELALRQIARKPRATQADIEAHGMAAGSLDRLRAAIAKAEV